LPAEALAAPNEAHEGQHQALDLVLLGHQAATFAAGVMAAGGTFWFRWKRFPGS
jgi:hypothetical protein